MGYDLGNAAKTHIIKQLGFFSELKYTHRVNCFYQNLFNQKD